MTSASDRVHELARASVEDERGELYPDSNPLSSAYEQIRETPEGKRFAAAVGERIGDSNWIVSRNANTFVCTYPESPATDVFLRRLASHPEDDFSVEALAAAIGIGNLRAIDAGHRLVGRGGTTLVRALMKADRQWMTTHFAEALTRVRVPGQPPEVTVPNVFEWPRGDVTALLHGKSIYLNNYGQIRRFCDVWIFSDEGWFNFVEGPPRERFVCTTEPVMEQFLAEFFLDPVSTEFFSPYSAIPQRVIDEMRRRRSEERLTPAEELLDS